MTTPALRCLICLRRIDNAHHPAAEARRCLSEASRDVQSSVQARYQAKLAQSRAKVREAYFDTEPTR